MNSFWGLKAEVFAASRLLMASSIFVNMKLPHSTDLKYSGTALISAGMNNKKVLHATGYTPGHTPGDSLQLVGPNSTQTPLALAHWCVEWTSVVSSKAKHELWKFFSLSVSLAPPHTNMYLYVHIHSKICGDLS